MSGNGTQDYPVLAGSAVVAANYMKALVGRYIPERADDAHKLAEGLFACALERSRTNGYLNLITMIDQTPFGVKVRFELHYPNDLPDADVRSASQALSTLADAYGERETRRGRMTYGELWEHRRPT
jgi:hypothetical protein